MTRDLSLAAITPSQQDLFLQAYRTHGLFTKAAQAAGVTKSSIEKYCQAKTADAEQFQLNVEQAASQWADTIEAEITRRAITGIDRDLYYKGEYIATEKVYSDTLLLKLAEVRNPDFAKSKDIAQPNITIAINTFQPEATPTLIVDVTPTYISDLE